MASRRVISAYDPSPEGDDGLVLARTLAELMGDELLVARVPDVAAPRTLDRAHQLDRRSTIMRTRASVTEAMPDVGEVDVVMLADGRFGRALHDLAEREHARFLVFGPTRHGRAARALLTPKNEIALARSPCPVAIAPRGYREAPGLSGAVVSVGYEGSAAARRALATGAALARAAGAHLRVVAAHAPRLQRPIPGTGVRDVESALTEAVCELEGCGVPVTPVVVRGSPERVLREEARTTGLLVMGTHARGPVLRTALGSVATHVLRRAGSPIVLCPPSPDDRS